MGDFPTLVMPLNDPQGILFSHLRVITPMLRALFGQAFVSVTRETQDMQADHVAWLVAEQDFFDVMLHDRPLTVGEDFMAIYAKAAAESPPDRILHLCYLDRLAFALQTHYRQQFMDDIGSLAPEQTPLIFLRSPSAWQTHPQNYQVMEQFVTTVACYVLDQEIDLAWCHMALRPAHLQAALANVTRRDIAMVAEMALGIREKVKTKTVDWLAWEDPFVYGESPQRLKRAREKSTVEVQKRLNYVIPMLGMLREISEELS